MRRRKRGSRGTWLPVLPTTLAQAEGPDQFATWYESPYSAAVQDSPASHVFPAQAVPVVPDFTFQDSDLTAGVTTLRDMVEGQDYVLKRTVGKVWASSQQVADAEGPNGPFIFCIAMAVLPVQDDQQDVPALPNDDFNPLLSQNSQQPWLWRRTWILQNTIGASAQQGNWPAVGAQSTWQYGSIADGGHLDTKVARRLTKDQRLFIIAAASNMFNESSATFPQDFRWGYDLRFFGAMRKARNHSTFK